MITIVLDFDGLVSVIVGRNTSVEGLLREGTATSTLHPDE